jgi:hypothetical protein
MLFCHLRQTQSKTKGRTTCRSSGGTHLWVESVLDAQELDARITVGHPYYEGATNITGDARGTGFMELPGYTTMPNIIKKPFEWLFDQFRRGTRL